MTISQTLREQIEAYLRTIGGGCLDTHQRAHALLRQAADRLASLEGQIERAEANSRTLIATEEGYRASERQALRRLSDALTGGNAGTWEEIFHAAEQIEAQVASLEHELAVATGARDAFRQSRDTLEAVVASLEQAQQALRAQIQQVMESIRAVQIAAGQCSVDAGGQDAFARLAAAEAERCGQWADVLSTILTSQEKNDQGSCGPSTYPPTADRNA